VERRRKIHVVNAGDKRDNAETWGARIKMLEAALLDRRIGKLCDAAAGARKRRQVDIDARDGARPKPGFAAADRLRSRRPSSGGVR
jgi:hypothetical protein